MSPPDRYPRPSANVPAPALGEDADRSAQVRRMFDRIAARYDLLNAVMTAGVHHRWSERAAERAGLRPGDEVLDVCCGTGDLTVELASRLAGQGTVIGCDFSEPMLDLARAKAAELGMSGIRFESADALDLPYEDTSFDALTVGYGVRNFTDRRRGLAELVRVLRPGGRLVVLEFTAPRRAPFSTFYGLWFDRLVPLLGRLSGDPGAYAYLPRSVRDFPGPYQFAAELDSLGLDDVRYTILAGGIVTIHCARR